MSTQHDDLVELQSKMDAAMAERSELNASIASVTQRMRAFRQKQETDKRKLSQRMKRMMTIAHRNKDNREMYKLDDVEAAVKEEDVIAL
jgi:hypothetical protein